MTVSSTGAIATLLHKAVDAGEIAGAVGLVARGDAVDVEAAGWQDLSSRTPMRRDTIVRILSMTKPILAAAALMLVEDGRIELDAPVDPWLPELADRSGTSFVMDPARGLVAILLTQRLMTAPDDVVLATRFQALALTLTETP